MSIVEMESLYLFHDIMLCLADLVFFQGSQPGNPCDLWSWEEVAETTLSNIVNLDCSTRSVSMLHIVPFSKIILKSRREDKERYQDGGIVCSSDT